MGDALKVTKCPPMPAEGYDGQGLLTLLLDVGGEQADHIPIVGSREPSDRAKSWYVERHIKIAKSRAAGLASARGGVYGHATKAANKKKEL